MKLAFCLYKYFPYGGLQRDFMSIAKECAMRGHKIVVYTLDWQGEKPSEFEIILVPVHSLINYKRYKKYTDWVSRDIKNNQYDSIIGINKMPGLDIYYAADGCYQEKALNQRSWLYRILARYRHFSNYEKIVFSSTGHTKLLMLSEQQQKLFMHYYHTPIERFHLLPPGVSLDRVVSANAEQIRRDFRAEYKINCDEKVLLMVGSGFRTKGLDRALQALYSLPENVLNKTYLIVVGQDNPAPFLRLAKRLKISNRVRILPGRSDIPRFLSGADILIHPAYLENTGTVLLEAMASGLPVLTTDVCGFSNHIDRANAGLLVKAPFSQTELNQKLAYMLTSDQLLEWKQNGIEYTKRVDLYSLASKAADIIEMDVIQRHKNSK